VRTRPQKYKNSKVFKNDMHDSSDKTKALNALDIRGCCPRCKEVIQWKIKYKKYKPLTVYKKCVSCAQKNVKRAYYIYCDECIKRLKKCGKCGQADDHEPELGKTEAEEASLRSQLEQDLKLLPERKRRALNRLAASGKLTEEDGKDLLAAGSDCDDHDHKSCSDEDDVSDEEGDESNSDSDSGSETNVK